MIVETVTVEEAFAKLMDAVIVVSLATSRPETVAPKEAADKAIEAVREFGLAVFWEQEAADTNLKSEAVRRRIEALG